MKLFIRSIYLILVGIILVYPLNYFFGHNLGWFFLGVAFIIYGIRTIMARKKISPEYDKVKHEKTYSKFVQEKIEKEMMGDEK